MRMPIGSFAAGLLKTIMSLPNALGRLRNQGTGSETSSRSQKSPATDRIGMGRSVFSLDETDTDIFDFDSDLFSGDCGITTSPLKDKIIHEADSSIPKPSSISSTSSSTLLPSPNHGGQANTSARISNSVSTTQPLPNSPGNQISRHSNSPSPSSTERPRTYMFKKRPSSVAQNDVQRLTESDPPPPKRINSVNSTSPTADDHSFDLFDEELINAFISESESDQPRDTLNNSPPDHITFTPTSANNEMNSFKAPRYPPPKFNSTNSKFITPSRPFEVNKSLIPSTSRNLTPRSSSTEVNDSRSFDARKQSGNHSKNQESRFSTPLICPQSNSSSMRTPQSGQSGGNSGGGGPVVTKRRFPGPAGILPPLSRGQSLDGIVIRTSSLPTPASTPQLQNLLRTPSRYCTGSQLHSQDEDDSADFSIGPWVTMMQDLDMDDEHSSPLLEYTIARALKQASCQQLKNGKVPHLRAVVKSIVPACRNHSAVLKDPTGEILCTIHQAVIKENKELQPGAALILRQVTVFSPAPRKHYLNITPDNIVIVYPPSTSGRSSTTSSTAPRTICLTEVEKRHKDQDTKENYSPRNSCFSNSSTPPLSSSSLHCLSQEAQSYYPHQMESAPINQTGITRQSTTSSRYSSACPQGSTTSTQHPIEQEQQVSFFSNQLCEDEFDSIMNCLGSELDF